MSDVCFYLTHYAVSKTYKFFYLADKMREAGISVEIILCSTEKSGILESETNEELLSNFVKWNIQIKSRQEAEKYFKKNQFKYLIVGCYSGDIQSIISSARKNGSLIVEIATIGFNDPIEHHADINLLISDLAFKAALDKRPQRAKKAKNIFFVGSLFSDDIENTYTSKLRSQEDFRKKYNLDNNRVFSWMPGRDDMENLDFQKQIYLNMPSEEKLVMTLHPWTEKYQQNYLKKIKKYIQTIDSNDVYWAFKTMTSGIARNSTAGIELCVLKKPVIYIGKYTRRKYLEKYVTPIGYKIDQPSELKAMSFDFNSLSNKYSDLIDKIYPNPYKPAWLRIRDFFVDRLCK